MKLIKLFLVVFLQIYAEALAESAEGPSVVIIGAGVAGLAAASRLLENNCTNVRVLEAEDRTGGRIHSVFLGDAYVDLGAESCHGTEKNVVYDMVKDLDVLKHFEYPRQFYHSSRKPVDRKFSEEFVQMIDSIYAPDGHRNVKEGRTLGQYCITRYNASIYDKYQKFPEKLEMAKSCIDYFHHSVLSYEGSFTWFEPSAKNDYTDCEGDLNLSWNGFGYKTLLEVLVKKIPDPTKQLSIDEKVLLGKEATKVLWSPGSSRNSVTVVCSDGSTFTADHVIFTPSIGVLKNSYFTMFRPKLPKSKVEAINQIGIGGVMKIAMYFEKRWWSQEKNFTGFNFIWSEDDKKKVSEEFPEGPTEKGRSWLTEIYTVYAFENNPKVLVGWITGKLVPEIEMASNDTIIRGIKFCFNKFLGHKYNITEPDSIVRTSWYTNPHFRGSYSYQTPGARKSNITAEKILSEPLLNKYQRPILHFAGEATHPYFYSTVHGAIETGFREADRILNWYKKDS